MSTEHGDLTWTLRLLLLSGVLCAEWNVDYQQTICAVKGSSVVIPCSFHYPSKRIIKVVKWDHDMDSMEGPFIYDSSSDQTSSRYQYIGDKHHNCSLKVNPVEQSDAGRYRFRFESDSYVGKWTGQGGSTLKIVDPRAVVKSTTGNTVKEGDFVNLSCSWCDGGDDLSSAFVWLKNGEPFSEGPSLSFKDISSVNSGKYACSLKALEGTTSGVVHVNVEHGPKNTSGSVTPSTEVHTGASITLTCSSFANPPVETYTWFKNNAERIVRVGNKSELHLKQVSPADTGEYLCGATNGHGSQNSSVVTLRVKGTFTRNAIIIASAAAVTALLFATAVRRLTGKKRTRAPETEPVEDMQNTVYLNWPLVDDSQEGDRCEGVLYTTVDYNTKRKSNMQQQMDSQNEDEGVIYSEVYSLCTGTKP